ncbi:MAG: hypothetical protein U1E60_22625 [Reyranellaceae bacterium]
MGDEAPRLLLAGLPAAAQTSGSIEIFDIMAPGERRRVTPGWGDQGPAVGVEG